MKTIVAHNTQIEQFIESIFPSQAPNAISSGDTANGITANMTPEDLQKKKEADAEASSDVFYMGLAVFSVILIMSIFMVRIFSELTGRIS